MKNVTITLEEDVARWARIRAAEMETSVSRLVGEMLREKMLDDERYEVAHRDYMSRDPERLKSRTSHYPSRDEIHDRAGLR